MTLDDFLTSTELKDGLTTADRVNDLITTMQKERDCVVENIDEATRQRSAVASTIAATNSKECLDLFVQLDGLWFINKWLKDALTFTKNSFVDKSINLLLQALETLQIDNHMSVSSGIGTTLQNLCGHSSGEIQGKAKALCDTWMIVQENNTKLKDAEKLDGTECHDNEENNVEKSEDEKVLSVCCNAVQEVGDTTRDEVMDTTTAKVGPLDSVGSSNVLENENLSVQVETPKSKSGTCDSSPTSDGQLDNCVEDAKEKPENDSLVKAGSVELATFSGSLKQKALPLSSDVNNALETDMVVGTSDKDEDMVDHHCRSTMELGTTDRVDDSGADALQVSPRNGYKSGEDESPKTTSDTESEVGAEDTEKQKHVGVEGEEGSSGNDSHNSMPSPKARDGDLMSHRPSDMELDYGMVDPLELARQVAIEVGREVDSREQSCSTSQNSSERSNTLDSANGKQHQHQPIGLSGMEVSSVNNAETVAASRVPEMAPERAPDTDKGFLGFDLNEEVSFEEVEFSTPISFVSASRAAAATGLPVAPLQFEGTLGWKGSAATSAFRPIPEVDKTTSSKQRVDLLDIDLNVAEDHEDKFQDLFSRKEESSSPRRLERLQLDLNSLGDVGVDQSPPQSSSSSSMQPQPLLRNIDLNLSFQNENRPFVGKILNNSGYKRDESVISIFGNPVELRPKDSVSQPNGWFAEPALDFGLGRTGPGFGLGSSVPYANPGFVPGHPMSFAMPMYGPPPGGTVPYMVDSRGAPIVPQFMMNMGSNGAGPSRHNFDLMLDGGNSNSGGLRHFFNSRSVDEPYSRASNSLQASSSSVGGGGKRPEPDTGWDLFPINYKHHQPPPWQ